jgi:hypothetical protein
MGGDRHEVVSDYQPEAIRVLFAGLEDARAFVEGFEIPLVPIGDYPRRGGFGSAD